MGIHAEELTHGPDFFPELHYCTGSYNYLPRIAWGPLRRAPLTQFRAQQMLLSQSKHNHQTWARQGVEGDSQKRVESFALRQDMVLFIIEEWRQRERSMITKVGS